MPEKDFSFLQEKIGLGPTFILAGRDVKSVMASLSNTENPDIGEISDKVVSTDD